MIQQNPNSEGGYSDGSVTAFISFKGEVFKPASWRAPAKGVRFDFRIIKEREAALDPAKASWSAVLYITAKPIVKKPYSVPI